jgi:hypothetical protein
MKWSTLFGLYLLGFGLTVHAGVYDKSLVLATKWLVSNQNPDGSWGPTQDVQPLYTSAVVHALESESKQQNTYYAGLTWLESRDIKSVDLIARQVDALASHGDDLSSAQTYLQNAQSHIGTSYMGWGLSGFYTSSTIDTALALIANADIGSSAQIQPAIDFLKSNQLVGINNQGWAVNNSGSSDPAITALVIQALARYTVQDGTLAAIIGNGLTTLTAIVPATASPILQALSAQAAQDAGNTALASAFLTQLSASQSVDGSWNADPYATALAMRAMATATNSSASSAQVSVPDQALRRAINLALGHNAMDSITMGEMAQLTSLSAIGAGIVDLTGLQAAINLNNLNLNNNNIKSTSPFANLPKLTSVSWMGNPGNMSEQIPALLVIVTTP